MGMRVLKREKLLVDHGRPLLLESDFPSCFLDDYEKY